MAVPAIIPLMIQGGRFALPRIMGMGKEFIAKQGGLPYLTSGSRAVVQRANTLPATISGGRSGLPALIKNPLSIFGRGGRSKAPPNVRSVETPTTGTAVVPYSAQQGVFTGSAVPSGIRAAKIPGISNKYLTMTGLNLAGAGMMAPGLIEDEAEISANQEPSTPPKAGTEGGAAGSTIEETKKFTKEKEKEIKTETDNTEKKIKKGELDDYIKDNMAIFDKYLGDGKEKTKAGLYNAMVQFGLNLASSRGGNFADKVARSAKEPMQEFARLGNALSERADKIKMAAVEQGLKRETEERAFEREKELTELEAAGGTDFQQNLATIRTLAPNLSNEDAIKLAKGIKIDDGVDGFIQKNIVSFMQQTDEDVETATKQLADIYNSSTALATAPTVSEADIANQPDGAPFKVEGRGEVFVKEGDQLRIVG